jgi:hypothetical protein
MKRNKTLLSLLAVAALSLPFGAFAADSYVTGSTDEARVAAHSVVPAATQETHSAAPTAAGSTDEARAAAATTHKPAQVARSSDCTPAGTSSTAGTTDEARAEQDRALNACTQA